MPEQKRKAQVGNIVHFRSDKGCQAAVVAADRDGSKLNLAVFKVGYGKSAKDKPVFLAPNTAYGLEEKHWHYTNECRLDMPSFDPNESEEN